MTKCPYHDLPCECAAPNIDCLNRAIDAPLPPGQPQVDYTLMPETQMLSLVGDSGARWARAFIQHMAKQGMPHIDEHLMVGWFSNVIETSYSVRNERAITKLVVSLAGADLNDNGPPERRAYDPEPDLATTITRAQHSATPVERPAAVESTVQGESRTSLIGAWSRESTSGRGESPMRGAGPVRRLLQRLGFTGS